LLQELDRPVTIGAICVIYLIATLFFNLLPIFVGAAAADRGWGDAEIGFFASSGMMGIFVGTLAAPYWVRRWAWRPVSLTGLITGGALFCLLPWVGGVPVTLACMFLVGVTLATNLAICIAAISDTTETERTFGIALTVQVLGAAGAGVLMEMCAGIAGFAGASGMLEGFMLAGALVVRWLPDRGRVLEEAIPASGPAAPATSPNFPMYFALFGSLIFYLATSAIWTFWSLIGERAEISSDLIAQAVSVGLLAGGLGSFLGAVLGQRLGSLLPIGIGVAATGVSFAVVALWQGAPVFAFFGLGILFNAGWALALVYQMSATASLDQSGRQTVLITAFQAAGGGLGPALAGLILELGSFAVLVMVEGAILLVSFLIFAFALKGRGGEGPAGAKSGQAA